MVSVHPEYEITSKFIFLRCMDAAECLHTQLTVQAECYLLLNGAWTEI